MYGEGDAIWGKCLGWRITNTLVCLSVCVINSGRSWVEGHKYIESCGGGGDGKYLF